MFHDDLLIHVPPQFFLLRELGTAYQVGLSAANSKPPTRPSQRVRHQK
jgi:hypothetical protein